MFRFLSIAAVLGGGKATFVQLAHLLSQLLPSHQLIYPKTACVHHRTCLATGSCGGPQKDSNQNQLAVPRHDLVFYRFFMFCYFFVSLLAICPHDPHGTCQFVEPIHSLQGKADEADVSQVAAQTRLK